MAAIARSRKRRNPGVLGWTAITVGGVLTVLAVGAGVVFYRMTRM